MVPSVTIKQNLRVAAVAVLAALASTACEPSDPAIFAGMGGGLKETGTARTNAEDRGMTAVYLGGNEGAAPETETETLAEALDWVFSRANSSSAAYTIVIKKNEQIGPQVITADGPFSLRLTGQGGERRISLIGTGALFTLESNVQLTLDENITLVGRNNNTASLVRVNQNASLVLQGNSRIIDNQNSTENPAAGPDTDQGGGVFVFRGRFRMSGGDISGNEGSYGGGILSHAARDFLITGGSVSRNRARLGGGGIALRYTETAIQSRMSGVSIVDNVAHNGAELGRGGGILLTAGELLLGPGVAISGNSALGTGDDGGGGIAACSEDGTAPQPLKIRFASNVAFEHNITTTEKPNSADSNNLFAGAGTLLEPPSMPEDSVWER